MAGIRPQIEETKPRDGTERVLPDRKSASRKRPNGGSSETNATTQPKEINGGNGQNGSNGRGPTADRNGSDRDLEGLVRTIEGEIIPRLVLAHRQEPHGQSAPDADTPSPTQADVEEFTRLILTHDIEVALSFVDAMRAQGTSLEAIFLDLLAPSARRLGDLWVADLCSFMDVTLGLGGLQRILRVLSQGFADIGPHGAEGRRALLVSAPGEQHTFGVSIVGEFLRRAGWDVMVEPGPSERDLAKIVGGERFALFGMSLGSENRLDLLTKAIDVVRRNSRNGAIGVMVGGQVFVDHPGLVERVGADTTAADGRDVAEQAEGLINAIPTPYEKPK